MLQEHKVERGKKKERKGRLPCLQAGGLRQKVRVSMSTCWV